MRLLSLLHGANNESGLDLYNQRMFQRNMRHLCIKNICWHIQKGQKERYNLEGKEIRQKVAWPNGITEFDNI